MKKQLLLIAGLIIISSMSAETLEESAKTAKNTKTENAVCIAFINQLKDQVKHVKDEDAFDENIDKVSMKKLFEHCPSDNIHFPTAFYAILKLNAVKIFDQVDVNELTLKQSKQLFNALSDIKTKYMIYIASFYKVEQNSKILEEVKKRADKLLDIIIDKSLEEESASAEWQKKLSKRREKLFKKREEVETQWVEDL